jgi:hypothetical protein
MSAQNTENNQKNEEKKGIRTLKTLLEWSAPSRVFKKRDKEYFTTIASIAVLIAIILLFFKEWLLIMVIVAMVFVTYVMATVPPEQVEHQITTLGIKTGGKNYDWEDLKRFWLSEKHNQKILYIDTKIRFPKRLILLLGETNEAEVKKMLSDYLSYEEPEKTWMDNAGDWLTKNIPLEK